MMLKIQERELIGQQIYNIISDVNSIVSFKYTDEELHKWAKSIIRLIPYVTVEIVAKITDKFLTGEEEFVRDIGLLNYTQKIPRYMGKI